MSNFLIRDPRCVFIHIPKAAGSSIRRGFFRGNHGRAVFGRLPESWVGHFKFTFVRNPFDRLVSAWKMFTTGMSNTVWRLPEDAVQDLSLSEFLDIVVDESILYDERRKTYKEIIRHHTIPQTHPFNCLHYAEFVGRFEHLQRDFARICQRLGIADARLPHWNATEHQDYRQYFDTPSRQIAEAYFRDDLETLGYRF